MILKHGFKCLLLLFIISLSSKAIGIEPYYPEKSNPFLEKWRWKYFEELDGRGVKSIVEDNSGNIWFSTNLGVYEYDGYELHLHDTLDGLSGLPVYQIARTRKGDLYASTRNGLFLLENSRWKNIFSDPTKSLDILRIKEIEGEGLFCLTANGFLRLSGSKNIQVFTSKALIERFSANNNHIQWISLPNHLFEPEDHTFTDIIKDKKGNFWLCINNNDDGKILKTYQLTDNGLFSPEHEILSTDESYQYGTNQRLLEASNGDIWIINGNTRIGIHIFKDDGKREYIQLNRSFGGDEFHWSIMENEIGEIFISGLGQFFVYDKKKWKHYSADNVPIPPSCRVIIYKTSDNNLWIGGYQNKIFKLDYSFDNWITYNKLNFQCESPDGKQWFIEALGRIVVKNKNIWYAYKQEDGLIDSPVRLICTRNGQLWVAGSHEGVAATAYLEDDKWIIDKHPLLSWGIDYRSVFESIDGSLWFGGAVDYQKEKGQKTGLIRLVNPLARDKKWIHYHTPAHGSMSFNTYGIAQSLDGRIWKGGLGLSYFEGERWFKIESPDELTDYVNIVHSSPGNKLYAGSRYYGLFVFDGNHWKVFNSNNGLTSNTIISIYVKSDSSIWLATDNDISYFDGSQWFVDLFPEEMMMKMEGGSIHEDLSGELWINKSPREWKRRALEYSHTNIDVYKKFKVFRYKPYKGAPKTYLKEYPEQIASSGQITFYWVGKDYFKGTEDKKLKYSYRLNDGEWSNFTSNRNHTYYKLPSGNYKFEVRAIDQDMNIDQSYAIAEFTVLPPIWKQGWFILLIIGMTITTIYFIIQIIRRDRKLLATNTELNYANQILSDQKEKIIIQKENLNKILITNEELSKTRLNFYTNISHEFRTPLTLIMANIENLFVRNLNYNDRKPIYKTIQRNSYRLLNLINQILEFRKIESGTIKLQTRKGDLVYFIKELTGLFSSLARKRNISLIINTRKLEKCITYFDPDKIEKIIYNLLSNAFKYTPEGGTIEIIISLSEKPNDFNHAQGFENYFKVSVKDTGVGISEKNLKQIFDRYFSEDSGSKYSLENTGIGLSYVKDLVTAHMGTIDVTSKLDKGTRFDVYIPCLKKGDDKNKFYDVEEVSNNYFSDNLKFAINELSKQYEEESDKIISDQELEPSSFEDTKKENPTILIVEDNKDMRVLLMDTLKNKYKIFEARNGKQALELADEKSIDLILSDVMMPVMNGIELCKHIKTSLNTSHIPVVLLTAKSFQEHQIEGLETGADDYVVKPFNTNLLLARIENILENRKILKQKFGKDFSFEPKDVKLPSADKEFLTKLVKLMEDHISDPKFNVDKMAHEMCISHAHFIIKVKSLTGQKPNQLLKTYRLKRAKQLLRQNEISISEVAYSVGYDNPSSFTRAFKAMYKQSPTEFIEVESSS